MAVSILGKKERMYHAYYYQSNFRLKNQFALLQPEKQLNKKRLVHSLVEFNTFILLINLISIIYFLSSHAFSSIQTSHQNLLIPQRHPKINIKAFQIPDKSRSLRSNQKNPTWKESLQGMRCVLHSQVLEFFRTRRDEMWWDCFS